MDDKKPRSGLDNLFNPRSVAIIGATEDPTRIGGRPLRYLKESGFQGEIWPVKPASRPGARDRGATGHLRSTRRDRCCHRGGSRRENRPDHRGLRRAWRGRGRGVHFGLRRNGCGGRGPAAPNGRGRARERDAHPGSQLSWRVQRRDRILRDVHHHPRHLPSRARPGRHREPERRIRIAPRSSCPPAPHRSRALGDHRQRVRRHGARMHRLDGDTPGNSSGGSLRGRDAGRRRPSHLSRCGAGPRQVRVFHQGRSYAGRGRGGALAHRRTRR